MNVERALEVLKEPSPLRGQVYALWGDSLAGIKQYAKALEQYERAIGECDSSQTIDVHYHLGESEMALGRYEDARDNFEKIPYIN